MRTPYGLGSSINPPPSDSDEPEIPRPRLRRIAFMAALFIPFGGGHMYARSHASAWLLAALSIGGFIGGLTEGAPPMLSFLPIAVVLYDLIAAPFAATRYNGRAGWSVAQQLIVVLPSVLLLTYGLAELGMFFENLDVPEVPAGVH